MADIEAKSNEKEETDDFASLEYEEDCFYALVHSTNTPSFDVEDTVWEEENDSLFVLVDDEEFEPLSPNEIPENFTVETEFYDKKLGKNKFMKAVRVRFQDLSKPYLAKITSQKNYTRFLQLVNGESPRSDMSPDSGINELAGLSPEEQEKQKQEWAAELAKIEEEINAMRQVLNNKIKCSQELKRKLGFSVWREFQDDMSQGLRNVKESNIIQSVEETVGQIGKAVTEVPLYQSVEEKVGQFSKAVVEAPLYQKTESVIKATTEKTSSILGGIGSGISSKLGQLKNSESFKSFEEKVGSAYENVKTKVSTSRSSSMQSFDEALRETERKVITPVTTPTINE